MKNLSILLFTLATIIFSNGWCQIITTTNATGPANCDGTATLQTWSNYTDSTWTLTWYQDSTQIAVNDSTVTGLCGGNYSLVFDSIGIITNTEYFSIGTPCSNLTVSLSATNTIQNSCTGSISCTVVGGSAPYTYMWSNGQTTQNSNNLCVGTYTLLVTDMMGCTSSSVASVYSDTIASTLLSNLDMIDDSTGNCAGGGNSFPSGGTPPYEISWSNGQTGNYSGQLCAGVYTVTISDQGGDTLTETFVIADLNSSYGNTIYNDSLPVATLYGNLIANCTIDYSSIDSASLSVAVYDSLSQNLYVTWSIYDSTGNVTYIYDTLGLVGNPGVYNVNISVYCPTKNAAEYFKVFGDFYFNGSSTALAVDSHTLDKIEIYPNPFATGFTIENPEGTVIGYDLVDLNGRVLKSNSKVSTGATVVSGLDQLSNGTYFLRLSGIAGTQRVYKLVK